MHLCNTDLYEEDNPLPLSGLVLGQICLILKVLSRFTTPETYDIIKLIHAYTHHCLGRLVWGPEFSGSCTSDEISS